MSKIEISGYGGKVTIGLLGYAVDSVANYFDANWLSCELDVDVLPVSSHMGLTFMTSDFVRLLEQLETAATNLPYEAHLESELENFKLSVKFHPDGKIIICGVIHADSPCIVNCIFEIDSDAYFLARTVEDLKIANQAFRVRGTPE